MAELSERTMDDAYARAGGRCECRRSSHRHRLGRCWHVFFGHATVSFRTLRTAAEGGDDRPHNCEVLCARCAERAQAEERTLVHTRPRRRR